MQPWPMSWHLAVRDTRMYRNSHLSIRCSDGCGMSLDGCRAVLCTTYVDNSGRDLGTCKGTEYKG